ncbi:mitochondrial calcium uniporter regulator 1 [Erethizon dorsatum]
MDVGSVAGERPKRQSGRRRLLLLLPAGRCGSPGGLRALARRGLSPLPGGLGALRPRGGASRASPLLLLLLVPPPRRAAAAPRRPLADWERAARPGPPAPPAGRGAWRGPAGTGAGGALLPGPTAALASSRRELSLSVPGLQLEHKRTDFTSPGNRKLYFDTHALVCLLEENGFITQQAEIIASALVKITEANMDIAYKDMVTKVQQEITLQQIMSKIASVKKDMIILEKSEFSALRAENEKIKLELHQLKQQVTDEVIKIRTDTKLDFNLEKSRVKELYSLNERKLLELRTEIVELHAQQDRALTQTDRKIETEVAGLKTMLEAHKLDTIKYLAGSVFTCLTVALGFYRLWQSFTCPRCQSCAHRNSASPQEGAGPRASERGCSSPAGVSRCSLEIRARGLPSQITTSMLTVQGEKAQLLDGILSLGAITSIVYYFSSTLAVYGLSNLSDSSVQTSVVTIVEGSIRACSALPADGDTHRFAVAGVGWGGSPLSAAEGRHAAPGPPAERPQLATREHGPPQAKEPWTSLLCPPRRWCDPGLCIRGLGVGGWLLLNALRPQLPALSKKEVKQVAQLSFAVPRL